MPSVGARLGRENSDVAVRVANGGPGGLRIGQAVAADPTRVVRGSEPRGVKGCDAAAERDAGMIDRRRRELDRDRLLAESRELIATTRELVDELRRQCDELETARLAAAPARARRGAMRSEVRSRAARPG